jgi:hypothetical protein
MALARFVRERNRREDILLFNEQLIHLNELLAERQKRTLQSELGNLFP